ncbi:MAG: hypothetical protein AUG49_26115 [Catenulispora sp. 13_1_20CM_3_70_7]|nr:MAG: hypothetical protein AUG49_26115 [Catenulispora sp. 13_1_20CM_3_70_7]
MTAKNASKKKTLRTWGGRGPGRHRKVRRACRLELTGMLRDLRAAQLRAAVSPRPAKEIARAARHEATRALGGRWNV